MKRYVTLFASIILFFIPSLSRADLDMQGIKDALGLTKDYTYSIGALIISLEVFVVAVLVIIKMLQRAGALAKANAKKSDVAPAFTEHKKFTVTPNSRYGSTYNRQKYKNQVYDDLFTHSEFVQFSARLHEREVEFLKKQKEEASLSEQQQIDLDMQIELANKRIAEFENEQEDLHEQMQYVMSKEAHAYDDDGEIIEEECIEIDYCPHGVDVKKFCSDCADEGDRAYEDDE